MNGFQVLTLTHRTASLPEVGQFVLGEGEALRAHLEAVKKRLGWQELLYLATCNRVVFVFYDSRFDSKFDSKSTSKKAEKGLAERLVEFLKPDYSDKKSSRLAQKWQLFEGKKAVAHLFEVAASLDSLVVGEREIFRQLREADDRCRAWNLTGDNIRLLMKKLVEASKSVFSSTGLGQKSVSVVALAFQKMLEAGLSPSSRVLLVGAGQTNELLSKFLKKTGCREVVIFNRSLEKSRSLAAQILPDWRWAMFHQLQSWQRGFDFLVVCTSANEAVISPALFEKLVAADPKVGSKIASKIVVDLSVPANVCSSIAKKENVQLIEIEGLKSLADQNRAHRKSEMAEAKKLLKIHLAEFFELHAQRKIERVLADVPTEIRLVRDRAKVVFQKDFENLSPETRALFDRVFGYYEEKAIAAPMKRARQIAQAVA